MSVEAEETQGELGRQRGLRASEVSRGRRGRSPRRRGSCAGTEKWDRDSGNGVPKGEQGLGGRAFFRTPPPSPPGEGEQPGPCPAWRLGTGRARRAHAGERASEGLRPLRHSTVTVPDASARGLDRDQGRRSTEDCSIRTPGRRGYRGAALTRVGAPSLGGAPSLVFCGFKFLKSEFCVSVV